MFKSIRVNERYNYYEVEDDDFVHRTFHSNGMAIIEAYKTRNLPVLPNLQLYYGKLPKQMRLKELNLDADTYAVGVPNFQFGEKYYPCIKRHLEKLAYIGK